ncbi:MAG TPA: nucleoside deaminase [Bacteroidales bacterium]|nr:nucleoside deaminase [Bacteroidales bacterium]
MKRALLLVSLVILMGSSFAQQSGTLQQKTDLSYFVTRTRDEEVRKLVDLPCGIKADDAVNVMMQKVQNYLLLFKPEPEFPDDVYARAANLQAVKSVLEGGYGIGSVLINQEGRIIAESHNNQMQKHRSDLHAEMSLLTQFEESHIAKKYMNIYVYKPGLIVFSSAEPCPMCYIRINTAGCDTKYCTPGPDDGMASHSDYLPPAWKEMAQKHKTSLGLCSPVMQRIAHLLFYSYLLDNRGPK